MQSQAALPEFDAYQLDKIAADQAWLDLLHYKSHVFSGIYSQVDDEAFFLSEQGKENARAELVASLQAFYQSPDNNNPDQHAQCRFPARLHWLSSQLDMSSLPRLDCNDFLLWQQKINAQAVTLLFPSMFLNNPASMFGHTFLRLDSPNTSALLNYSLSYAAASDPEDSALAYVSKGLAGGYTGVFHVQPYYETVSRYGDIEHRDIWEYRLNLSTDEVNQMVRHIWELKTVDFDYYFLRENCSYRLLSLLDVARPGLEISRNAHPVYAIPADTVRSVSAAGLIEEVDYRPSRNSRIEQMASQMSGPLQDSAFQLLQGELEIKQLSQTSFEPRQQAQLLELAHEINQLRSSQRPELDHQILTARSQLDVTGPTFVFDGVRPDQSHPSARWSSAWGRVEQEDFIELGFRPTYHDLLDDPAGFIKGASIQTLDTRLRWYQQSDRLKLHSLLLFGITSLSPVTQWSTPWSVNAEIAYNWQPLDDNRFDHVTRAAFALGFSTQLKQMTLYLMAHSRLDYSRALDSNYALYAGLESGLIYRFEHSRFKLKWVGAESISGEDRELNELSVAYQYDLTKNQGLRLNYQSYELKSADIEDWSIRWLYYF